MGVYKRHAERHQGILSKTAEPDRRPGSRPVENGRRGPLLHRHRHADLGGSRCAAAGGGGGGGRTQRPLRGGQGRGGAKKPHTAQKDKKMMVVFSSPASC